MKDFRMLNGGPRCTLIERFDGSALLISPGDPVKRRRELKSLDEAKILIAREGLECNVSHLHAEHGRPKEETNGNEKPKEQPGGNLA